MVDSALTWAREYKVDGFRFDIMGHHMKSNLLKLRAALDALRPRGDGVDGREVYVYGEGWNFGEVANNARGVNATQFNMAGTGIGTFSDRLRDGARGGGPFSGLQEQGFLSGLWSDPNGTEQGDQRSAAAAVHGLDPHRPHRQPGRLLVHRPLRQHGDGRAGGLQRAARRLRRRADRRDQLRRGPRQRDAVRRARVEAARGDDDGRPRPHAEPGHEPGRRCGQGIPFFHAGVELLRSKSLDRNSYNSGDWFNKLDFTYQSNNWGVGLPPAPDNQGQWPLMRPLLANPDLRPAPEHSRPRSPTSATR